MNQRLKAKVAVLGTTFAIFLCTAHAHAAEPPAAPAVAQLVPADAAALLSLRLPEVEDGFAFADLLSGLYPKLAAAVTAVRSPLGLPAFSDSELADRGVLAEQPTFVSLFRVPAKLPSTAKGFAHRLVVPVSDPAKFAAYAHSVLARMKFKVGAPGRKAPAWAKALAAPAKKLGIELWGFDPVTAQGVALRFAVIEEASFGLLDVFTPDLPKPAGRKAASVFTASMKATLGQADIPMLSVLWNEGTRPLLAARASMVLVVQPTHMLNVLPAGCRGRWSSTAGSFFSDLAITARLNPFDWKVRVSFSPTEAVKPLVLKGGSNDGLIDTRALADAGLAAASLLLDDGAAWMNVPRPTVLGKTWSETTAQWDACGAGAVAITMARFWPHLVLGLFSETLETLQAPPLLKSARNLAVGLRSPVHEGNDKTAGPATLWMASFENDKQAALSKWLDERAEVPAENAAFGSRTPRLWSLKGDVSARTIKSAGVESLPGTHFGLALSPEETGLGWYYTEKRRPAVFSNLAALGALHVNIKRLLMKAAESADVDTRDAISLATSQISRMGGDLVSNGTLLELDLSLSGGGL